MSGVPQAPLLGLLLDHSDGILMLVEPQSLAIREVSRPALELLGYRREELIGRPITDIECSLGDAFFWEEVQQGRPLREGDAREPAIRHRNAEGSYRCAGGSMLATCNTVSQVSGDGRDWLVVRAEPLPPDGGLRQRDESRVDERRVDSVLVDELAAAAALLRATLEATADAILLVDRAGGIVNMNRRFSRLWDLPEPLLLTHDDGAVFDFMAARFADPDAYRSALARIAPDGENETFDVLQLADGRVLERKSMPCRHGMRMLGRVFSFTDITERRHAEAARAALETQLRESQKMEALGSLAGGVAHDFNNIIATILGNADLMRQDVADNRGAMASVDEIRKAGSRARDLVQQILSFSRRRPTVRRVIALGPVIEEAARLLRATLPARISLAVQCAADLPAAMADATQIEQAVINLATNSMQAMQAIPCGTGRIDIRLDALVPDPVFTAGHPALLALQQQHPGRTLRLTVTDTGAGMDATTLARAFEPFFTTKPVNEGTGLGLAVVYGIVLGHEGAIAVESEPGRGACFTIYLPVAPAEAAAATHTPGSLLATEHGAARELSAGTAQRLTGGDAHILYIDDDDAMVFLVRRLLERRGYLVSAYSDSGEALAALRDAPKSFDLVVSDYNMPGMSGLDVARAVRDIRPDLPVAIASGFIDAPLRADAAGAGVRELIEKVVDPEVFCNVVQRLAGLVGTVGPRSGASRR